MQSCPAFVVFPVGRVTRGFKQDLDAEFGSGQFQVQLFFGLNFVGSLRGWADGPVQSCLLLVVNLTGDQYYKTLPLNGYNARLFKQIKGNLF